MEFKDILREARNAKNLTQFDLAVQSGVSLPAIAKYETGASMPGWLNLVKLSAVVDLSAALANAAAPAASRQNTWSTETLLDLAAYERQRGVA